MKFKIVLIFILITISYVSCEREQSFSIDRCVGVYDCEVDARTMRIMPSGRIDNLAPPTTGYPKKIEVAVAKTGDQELTLTFSDRGLVARVNEQGRLTIPDADIYLENENFTMPLKASYTVAYITSDMLFIKQVATGTATCNDNGDIYTLTVINTQFFDGTKK